VRHQEPACQAILDLASTIGHGGIAGLQQEGMAVEQEPRMQGDAFCDRGAKIIGADSPSATRALDECLVGATIGSHDDRKAAHAFTADQAHLDALLVVAVGDHGKDAALRKVNVLDRPPAYFHLLPQGKIDGRELRFHQRKVGFGQARQNTIGCLKRGFGCYLSPYWGKSTHLSQAPAPKGVGRR
jgi:hypothetical protein